MKRWLLALLVLLGAANLAAADYVVIVVDLGSTKEAPTTGTLTGVPPGGGLMIGTPPGGTLTGVPPPGGMRGAPPGGLTGVPPPGGMRGVRGGFGGITGGPVMPPLPGGPGGYPGGLPEGADEIDSYFVVAVVKVAPIDPKVLKNFESEKFKAYEEATGERVRKLNVRHRWGATILYPTGNVQVQVLKDAEGKALPNVEQRYKAKHDELFKGKPDASEVIELARWALEHGLLDKCAELMKKLEGEKGNDVVTAFTKVQAELVKGPGKADVTGKWTSKLLKGYRVAQDDKHHYAVVHPGLAEADLKAQWDRLEDSFRGYFYWWALRGVALPVPAERLVALLPEKEAEFQKLQKHLSSGPLLEGAFFARRDGVAVIAAERTDTPYKRALTSSKLFWEKGFDRDKVITGKAGAAGGVPTGSDPATRDAARTYALLLKAMEEERAATVISHKASRQLLYATKLLPHNVAAPEWLLTGLGSFFETPLQSPWAGTGAPNSYWLPRFKEMKFEATPYDTLVKVVTDGYFRKSSKGKTNEADQRKARAASWALAYYLAQHDLAGLQRYFKELAKMPRDMELSDKALLLCFAKAFGCTKVDKGAVVVDPAKLRTKANEWFGATRRVELETESIHKQIREFHKKALDSRKNPPSGGSGGTTPGGGGIRPPAPPAGGGKRPPGGTGT